MSKLRIVLRYLWASPASAFGVLVAAVMLCFGGTLRRVDGTLEVAGGCLARASRRAVRPLRFVAITLGHVIVGVDHDVLARVRQHERVHVRQYERFGVFFFPIYLGSSSLQLLRGGDPYLDNAFEREAYAKSP
ncbi:MAG TPA: hypothetical protein VGL67_04800 [Casimicrobiaceae bacterium]